MYVTLLVLLLCVSGVSMLGWQTNGTRFDAYYIDSFFFPFALWLWQTGGHWFESARGTFFFILTLCMVGQGMYWRTHTSIIISMASQPARETWL